MGFGRLNTKDTVFEPQVCKSSLWPLVLNQGEERRRDFFVLFLVYGKGSEPA